VQVSDHAFRYYKNYFTSHGTGKPIISIPTEAIRSITPFTQANKEAFTRGKTLRKDAELENRLFDNMFEIHLNKDFEEIYLYRDLDAQ
jgi:hypothetical protein